MSMFDLLNACRDNKYNEIKKYLDGGPDLPLSGSFFYSWPPGFWVDAPLTAAAKNRAKECIKILLEYGADPDKHSMNHDGSVGLSPREIAPDLFE